MRNWLLCVFFGLAQLAATGQSTLPENDLIVLLHQHEDWTTLAQRWGRSKHHAATADVQKIGQRLPLFLVTQKTSTEDLRNWLQRQPEVRAVQYDGEVNFRKTPNDTQYFRQWDMDLIGAPEAWETTTGGRTVNGTPIVVAVMDSGFFVDHEDLADNLWHNRAEILGDSIDNDNNGYVDDAMGWGFRVGSPLINPGEHGLSSAAIVGGVGDNGRGITGVNWDLELMLFSFTKISDLVKSYDYVIDQREKFNNSNGTEGAFVVATSNSFGQNRVFCESKPVWAAMFDELGAVGVLSSYGVGNVRYDADVAGDMPASCPSDYLLISCNTDEDDNLFSSSAYGAVSVDLGAPGEGTVTARPNNTYGVFGGNSAATPHVSGAIALLYAGDCAQLETDARQAPAATALRIKDLLLQSAEQRPSLQNRTLTGGRLHVGDAMNLLTESCNNTLGELAILRLGPNPTDDLLRINYQVPENGTYELELFDALGRRCQHQQVEVNTFGIRRLDWDVSRLVAGVYWLRFGDGGAGVWKQVVVI